MQADGAIGFEPVTAEHYSLLRLWLEQPHVCEWWGEPDEEISQIRDMVEGRDATRPFLIMLASHPVGYIQVWPIGKHQIEPWLTDHPWLARLPADTVGVDLLIGENELLSKGVGTRVLKAFVGHLWDEGHRTIAIDPDPANVRAVRAYEKAGFRAVERSHSGDEEVLLMLFDGATP